MIRICRPRRSHRAGIVTVISGLLREIEIEFVAIRTELDAFAATLEARASARHNVTGLKSARARLFKIQNENFGERTREGYTLNGDA